MSALNVVQERETRRRQLVRAEPLQVDARFLPEHEKWRQRLTITSKNEVARTVCNVLTILTHASDWRGVLVYDEREEAVMFIREPPFESDYRGHLTTIPRLVTDEDDVRVSTWLERIEGISIVDVAGRDQR